MNQFCESFMPIADQKMAEYRITAKSRWLEEQNELSIRYDRAWIIAKQAAVILRTQLGVHRVVAFGSLTHKHQDTRVPSQHQRI